MAYRDRGLGNPRNHPIGRAQAVIDYFFFIFPSLLLDNVTFIVTVNVTLIVVWLCLSGLGCSLSAIPLLVFRSLGFVGLFSDDGVIEAIIGAQDEPAQRFLPDGQPRRHVATEAGKVTQNAVIVRQTGGRHLMPGGTPKRHRSAEAFCGAERHHVAVAQPHHVKRHICEVAEVEVRRS